MGKCIKLFCMITLIITILTSIFTGCTGKDASDKKTDDALVKKSNKDKVQISMWMIDWNGKHSNIIKEITNKFNNIQDDIYAKFTPCAPTGGLLTPFDDKFIPALNAGTAPDVVMFGAIHAVVEEDAVLDITDLIANDKSFSMEQYYPFKVEQCRFNERFYSLPYNASYCGALMFNKTLFKKVGIDPNRPPVTIDELDDYSQKLYVLDNQGFYESFGYIPWDLVPTSLVRPFGGNFFSDDGYPTPTDPAVIRAYEWAAGYGRKYGYDKIKSSLEMHGIPMVWGAMFPSGRVGMFYAFDGNVTNLALTQVSFEWSIAPFPTVEPGLDPGWSGGWNLSISKGTKHPKEAFEYLKYICGLDSQVKLMKNFDAITGLSPVIEANQIAKVDWPVQAQIFVDVIFPQVMPQKIGPLRMKGLDYNQLLWDTVHDVCKGTVDPRHALEEIKRKTDFAVQEFEANKQHESQ